MVEYVNVNGVKTPVSSLPSNIQDQLKNPVKPVYGGDNRDSRTVNPYKTAREAIRERERRIASGEKHTSLVVGVQKGNYGSGYSKYRQAKEQRLEAQSKSVFEFQKAEIKQRKEKEKSVQAQNQTYNQYVEQRAQQNAGLGQNPLTYVAVNNKPSYQKPVQPAGQNVIGDTVTKIGEGLSELAQWANPKYKQYVEKEKAEELKNKELVQQYDRLVTEYNKMPKIATSENEYQQAKAKYEKIDSLYNKITLSQTPTQPASQLGQLIEPVLNEIPKYQEKFAKSGYEGDVLNVGLGFGKEVISTVAAIDVLGTQTIAPVFTGEKPTVRATKIPDTAPTILLSDTLQGKSQSEIYQGQQEYAKKYGAGSLLGEYATFAIGGNPLKGVGGLIKAVPQTVKNIPKIIKAPANILFKQPGKIVKTADELDASNWLKNKNKPAPKKSELNTFVQSKVVSTKKPIGSKKVLTSQEQMSKDASTWLKNKNRLSPKGSEVRQWVASKTIKPNPKLKQKPTSTIFEGIESKPARRSNEIDFSGRGEPVVGKFSKISEKPVAGKQENIRPVISEKAKQTKSNLIEPDRFYKGLSFYYDCPLHTSFCFVI